MKKIILGIFLFGFCLTDVFSQADTSFAAQFKWLEGTWVIETESGNLVEKWVKVDSVTYKAVINFLTSPDDVVENDPLERITLQLRNKNIYFTSTVSGQNDDLPVEFIYTGVEKGWFIFENPKHDFPQKIKYIPVNEKTMYAKIEGLVNGKVETSEFNYTKE